MVTLFHAYDMRLTAIIILSSFLLTSCSELSTADHIEADECCAGAKPTDEVNVLNGQYWQSGHWTKEYILYLKVKPAKKWWDEFVNQNNLQIDTDAWTKPSDSPDWFQLTGDIEVFKQSDDFNDSRYFRNKRTGECYIYEIQL